MNRTIFLDIETIGTTRDDLREYVAANVTPPGNMKKAETIAKWEAEERPAAVAEAVARTALDGAFGEVACVGLGTPSSPVDAYCLPLDAANREAALLEWLNDSIDTLVPLSDRYTTTVVGHYISGFDLRFIVQRGIVRGIRPHPTILRAANAKPWEADKVFDTMTQWAGPKGTISLERLCLALDVPSPKGDLTGAEVGEAMQRGETDRVARYCAGDVIAVRECHRRMAEALGLAA